MTDEDRSLELLETLKDPTRSQDERIVAFEQMLALPSGWWGRWSLSAFAQAYALYTARMLMASFRSSPDQIDWEGVADESLMLLFLRANQIKSDPRGWLTGVIRNRLRNETRRAQEHLSTKPVTDESASYSEREPETIEEENRISSYQYDVLIAAVQSLPLNLRVVMQMSLFDRASTREIADNLRLSEAAVRQRLSRARKSLSKKLSELKPQNQRSRAR